MEIVNLKKIIEGKPIIENINLTLDKGQIIGLIGRNSVGKTTFFRTVVGHYIKDEGEILINGETLDENVSLKQKIFYIDEQYNFFSTYTLEKIGEFYNFAYPTFEMSRFLKLLEENNLQPKLKYRAMSKGMQGLFKMVLSIAVNVEYLFLDEPFDGLDVIVKKRVIRLLLSELAESDKMVMISSHNLLQLENLIDRVIILKDTTIAQDYLLDDFKSHVRKLQLVLKGKKIPEFLKKNSKALSVQGRVITVVIEQYTDELETQIKALDPVVFEELPLTLEDMFEVNLTKEADFQLYI
ncbi:MAG: ABC transporter ATP-binding protein [Lactobacillales bacterium]|jgi:ABC-2 type transport system ATP-binding protein|nr:ABC transporter ATP-binding protein [Lactobacillales bacterium]